MIKIFFCDPFDCFVFRKYQFPLIYSADKIMQDNVNFIIFVFFFSYFVVNSDRNIELFNNFPRQSLFKGFGLLNLATRELPHETHIFISISFSYEVMVVFFDYCSNNMSSFHWSIESLDNDSNYTSWH